MITTVQTIIAQLAAGATTAMSLEEIIKNEISEWQNSQEYKLMLEGQRYYQADADILNRERTTIGESGRRERIDNLANNKLVHNFLKKLIDQKVGYLLSKPLSIQTDNVDYQKVLKDYFVKAMLRLIQNLGKEAISKGRAWLHVYYNELGQLAFKKIPSQEIIPLWMDADHTELDALIRVYEVEAYEGRVKKNIKKVEFWSPKGVQRYVFDGNLIPDVEAGETGSHFIMTTKEEEKPANWERIPFICFKYNAEEIPLLKYIKSLIDDYDRQKSDNANNLEDLPNSIYVVKNFSGTQGGTFRQNISLYRVVFTDENGGVDSVNIEIDTEAYKNHMDMNRKDIYEFGRGVLFDADKLGNAPSGVALKFLYADLDMDCNTIETEFQASFEQLRWFIDTHLYNTTGTDYSTVDVDFIFNRDIIISESEVINDIRNSIGIISKSTLVANHPYVVNVDDELDKIEKEFNEEMNQYNGYDREFEKNAKEDEQ